MGYRSQQHTTLVTKIGRNTVFGKTATVQLYLEKNIFFLSLTGNLKLVFHLAMLVTGLRATTPLKNK
jgi:hypothetical protein